MGAIPLRAVEAADDEFERRAGGDRLTRFLLGRLFEQENRLRAVEGKPPLPEARFRAEMKRAFGR